MGARTPLRGSRRSKSSISAESPPLAPPGPEPRRCAATVLQSEVLRCCYSPMRRSTGTMRLLQSGSQGSATAARRRMRRRMLPEKSRVCRQNCPTTNARRAPRERWQYYWSELLACRRPFCRRNTKRAAPPCPRELKAIRSARPRISIRQAQPLRAAA